MWHRADLLIEDRDAEAARPEPCEIAHHEIVHAHVVKRHDVARQQRAALLRRQIAVGDGRRRIWTACVHGNRDRAAPAGKSCEWRALT